MVSVLVGAAVGGPTLTVTVEVYWPGPSVLAVALTASVKLVLPVVPCVAVVVSQAPPVPWVTVT